MACSPRPQPLGLAAGGRCGKIIPAREGGGGRSRSSVRSRPPRRREAGLDDRTPPTTTSAGVSSMSAPSSWTSGGGCTIAERFLPSVPIPLESALALFPRDRPDSDGEDPLSSPPQDRALPRAAPVRRERLSGAGMRAAVGPFPGRRRAQRKALRRGRSAARSWFGFSRRQRARPSSEASRSRRPAAAQAQHHSRRHDGPPPHSASRTPTTTSDFS